MQENKVIWITGASSGIGKALSIKFANQGWHVAAWVALLPPDEAAKVYGPSGLSLGVAQHVFLSHPHRGG